MQGTRLAQELGEVVCAETQPFGVAIGDGEGVASRLVRKGFDDRRVVVGEVCSVGVDARVAVVAAFLEVDGDAVEAVFQHFAQDRQPEFDGLGIGEGEVAVHDLAVAVAGQQFGVLAREAGFPAVAVRLGLLQPGIGFHAQLVGAVDEEPRGVVGIEVVGLRPPLPFMALRSPGAFGHTVLRRPEVDARHVGLAGVVALALAHAQVDFTDACPVEAVEDD